MMFRGTYTSEFYREVRNLLHEQVSRPRGANTAAYEEERRWQELLARAGDYRSRDWATTAAS